MWSLKVLCLKWVTLYVLQKKRSDPLTSGRLKEVKHKESHKAVSKKTSGPIADEIWLPMWGFSYRELLGKILPAFWMVVAFGRWSFMRGGRTKSRLCYNGLWTYKDLTFFLAPPPPPKKKMFLKASLDHRLITKNPIKTTLFLTWLIIARYVKKFYFSKVKVKVKVLWVDHSTETSIAVLSRDVV